MCEKCVCIYFTLIELISFVREYVCIELCMRVLHCTSTVSRSNVEMGETRIMACNALIIVQTAFSFC